MGFVFVSTKFAQLWTAKQPLILGFGLLFLGFSQLSCTRNQDATQACRFSATDMLGNKVCLPARTAQTCLALSPALTEMLAAVCAPEQIVGVTDKCNFPVALIHTKPKFAAYPVDIETVFRLSPQTVWSQAGFSDPAIDNKLEQMGIRVVQTRFDSISDVPRALRLIGTVMNRSLQAEQLASRIEAQADSLRATISLKIPPKILAIIWYSPIYAYGKNSIMNDKIKLAGGQNAITEFDKTIAPELSREYILRLNPDIILGANFAHYDTTFFKLYPELKQIKAYKNKHIFDLNDDLASRPSPRLIASVIEIRKCIEKAKKTN